ncbi:maltase A2-like [Formica exsecta]|uniref:maltase A2-like n=1 Tax=Formica exsecta TaxID=72781 RepID=UPI0011450468|nr:maltase A2-like [Formica exsecta]
MSLTIRLCALLLLVSGLSAEILNKSWWNNTVFYQIYPRSLYDTNADGVGDLKGITLKLPYIAETGVNAIWLSPIYPSPMVDFGYDISNFTGIDPVFGTMEDFKDLLVKAKKLGLKVVLDLVPNHSSDKHPWFQKGLQGNEKYKNYYMWADGKDKDDKTPPNNWISVFSGSAWEYVDSQKQWYFHQFDYRQPDLNFSNPDVRDEMKNVLKFWLDLGIDGFRIDSAPFIYEDPELRDEPRSYAAGLTPRDYSYLDHIYTVDQKPTYELFGDWRKYVDDYADEHNQDQKMMVMEAYTSFPHTMEYYNYNVTPFNFAFIINVTINSSAEVYKEKIDGWTNSMPSGKIANWVSIELENALRERDQAQILIANLTRALDDSQQSLQKLRIHKDSLKEFTPMEKTNVQQEPAQILTAIEEPISQQESVQSAQSPIEKEVQQDTQLDIGLGWDYSSDYYSVPINNIHLRKKAAVVYTSLEIP